MGAVDADVAAVSGAAPGAKPQPRLPEVARAFEALLLQQMLRAAQTPLAGEGLLDGGAAGRMYRELLHEEFARMAAEREGLGIARMLVERLEPDRPGAAPQDADR